MAALLQMLYFKQVVREIHLKILHKIYPTNMLLSKFIQTNCYIIVWAVLMEIRLSSFQNAKQKQGWIRRKFTLSQQVALLEQQR